MKCGVVSIEILSKAVAFSPARPLNLCVLKSERSVCISAALTEQGKCVLGQYSEAEWSGAEGAQVSVYLHSERNKANKM